MKILQTVQERMAAFGYGADGSLFNLQHARGVLVSGFTLTFQIVYFFCEAESVGDHLHSFFTIIAGIGIFIAYFTSILEKSKMSNFIQNFQKTVDKSE